jgi:hypothetical protein
MLFEFVLFAILGWCEFAPPASAAGKMVLMILFIVLMILWLVFGVTGFDVSHFWGRR